jgi:hypothetical protein
MMGHHLEAGTEIKNREDKKDFELFQPQDDAPSWTKF